MATNEEVVALLGSLGIDADSPLVSEPQRLGMQRQRERTPEEDEAARARQARQQAHDARFMEHARKQNRKRINQW